MSNRVVIIGGGFAGLHLAKKLSGSGFRVTLLDKQNHHQFQPLFYQVASARLEPANISFPFRKIFQKSPNIQFIMGTAKQIHPSLNQVEFSSGRMEYDHLVIATGCTTNFFGNTNVSQHALTMKSTLEAINIRNEILLNFEHYLCAPPEKKEEFVNLVIVGAGPTGVELAGAFAEMKKNILPKDFPTADFTKLKIYLIEGSDNTLNAMSETAKKASRAYLDSMGVVVMTGRIVSDFDGSTVTLKSGEKIKTRNLIWAAGVTGNVVPGIEESAVNRNRYIVDRFNRVKGYPNIYAIGDVAMMATPKYPNGHPQLANVAINQGRNLAKNLRRMASGEKPVEYEYTDKGSMATIGKHKAVVDLPKFSFHGRLAWFFWMFLHLMLILSVKNKLIIFINWAWHYFTKDTSLRLILKRE